MKLLSKIASVAAVALILLAVAQPAQAGCSALVGISTVGPDGATGFFNPAYFIPYYEGLPLYGSYYPGVTSNVQGSWWSLGNGNPAAGAGIDNGVWPVANWLDLRDAGGYYFPTFVTGDWGSAPAQIDGCVTTDVGPQTCTCVLISDETDGVGYYALFGAQGTATGEIYMNTVSDGTEVAVPMAPVPTPRVLNSQRDGGTGDLLLTIGTNPLGTEGNFSQDGCSCLGSPQFKVYTNTVATGSAPPVSRADNWVARGNPAPVGGASAAIPVDCGGAGDVYVAVSLVFDSGFETELSANSTRVACDPNIANPDDLQQLRPGAQRPREPREPRGGRGR